MLDILDLQVKLGRHQVLDGISLTARPGSVTAIVGPNGSGKTTLMRAMTGELAYRGRLSLNGHEIRDCRARDLAALRGVMAQSTQLGFPFTVLEVVRLGLVNGGGDPEALAALAQVGLAGYEARMMAQLSGGEQARVHLARVLVQVRQPVHAGQPRWLFLDEPVAALDIGQQLAVMRLARRHADEGGGVVAVMHDLNLSSMFADTIALVLKGRLEACGTPAEVLNDRHLSRAYGCPLRVNVAPSCGTWLLPQAVHDGG